jgi:hypothetical protein
MFASKISVAFVIFSSVFMASQTSVFAALPRGLDEGCAEASSGDACLALLAAAPGQISNPSELEHVVELLETLKSAGRSVSDTAAPLGDVADRVNASIALLERIADLVDENPGAVGLGQPASPNNSGSGFSPNADSAPRSPSPS